MAQTLKLLEAKGYVGTAETLSSWMKPALRIRINANPGPMGLGSPMKFITFEDETGLVETVFFPRAYARFSHILVNGYPYLLSGQVEDEWGATTLTVVRVQRT